MKKVVRKILIYVVAIAVILIAVSSLINLSANYVINQQSSSIKTNGLQIGFNEISADIVNIQTDSLGIELTDVHLAIQPWRWLMDGIHFKQLDIGEMHIKQTTKNKTPSENKNKNENLFYALPDIETLNISNLIIFDQSLGKIKGRLSQSKQGSHDLRLTLIDQQGASLNLNMQKERKNQIQFSATIFDQTLKGSVTSASEQFIVYIDDLADTFPKGIGIQQNKAYWQIIDVQQPKEILGKLDRNQGNLQIVSNKIDINLEYNPKKSHLDIKSRFWELTLNKNKTFEALIKLNQFPLSDRLLSGLVHFYDDNQKVTSDGFISIFHYQSKDKLTFKMTRKKDRFVGEVNFDRENGDHVKLAVSSDDLIHIVLKETGKFGQDKFKSGQNVTVGKDYFDIDWEPFVYANQSWVNDKKTRVSDSLWQLNIKPECFKNESLGALCFAVNLKQHSSEPLVRLSYFADKKIDLSSWLPKPFIISDLLFKGDMTIKYDFNQKYPSFDANIEDIALKFDPLVTSAIPMASHNQISSGHGKLAFKNNIWAYQLEVQTLNGGHATLDSQKENNLTWQNVQNGYLNHSYVISDGTGIWNQKTGQCQINMSFTDGRIILRDYYPSYSNPVSIKRYNIPIDFSISLTNQQPIKIDILGIEGLVNVDLSLIESESLWIANGEVVMLPGGLFRKDVDPISVKEGKIIYYNNDVLDPFIQLSLEKTQTLLVNDNQISNYKEELLGVRFYGKLQNYQIQTYSTPAGINQFVILQNVLINPVLFSPSSASEKSENLLSIFANSIRDIRNILPVDQITFRPAEREETLIDTHQEASSISMMKRLSKSIGLYARIGSLPQDNIFSLIYRRPERVVGTQLYSNYESQGLNLVFSH